MNEIIIKSIKRIKRLAIIVAGFTIVLLGIAMIFLPGPAIIVIPLGLGILATELIWARRLLERIKANVQHTMQGNNANEDQKEKK